jgi:AcrR family transcriptional regulator
MQRPGLAEEPEHRPLTARGEATRQRILEAARQEFGEKGFHAASVSSITTRANVGQGTFYIYFNSKDACYANVVRGIGQAIRAEVARATSGKGTMERGMVAGLQAFLDFTVGNPGLFRIIREAQFVHEAAFREHYERLVGGYADALERLVSTGECRSGDVRARAWALIGSAHFLGLWRTHWSEGGNNEEIATDIGAMLSHGMLAGRH